MVIPLPEGGDGRGPQDRRRLALVTQTQPHCRGAERCSETQPSGAEVPGRRRGPHRKNEVEVGQRPSLLLTTSFSPWVADATPHPHPCLKRRSLFIERAPWAGPPRRPPRGPPHYADVAEIGHFMPLPHLLRLADARVSTSRPKPHQPTRWYRCLDTPQCCLKASPPIATRLRRGGSPTSRPPPSPPHTGRGCHASHHTMPSAASPSISMHAEHGPCQAGPASPSIDADDTDAAPPPTPGCRLKDRHPYSRSRIAALPPSEPAHGRPAAYAYYKGPSAVPGHAR